VRARSLALVALLALASLAAWRLWPGEERKVRGRLDALAASLSIPAGETGLPRVARAASLRSFFTEDVTVELPAGAQPLQGRDEIAGLVARMSVPPVGTKVELLSVEIEVGPDSASADARFNARVVAREPRDKPPILDARMIAVTMRKVDGDWLVANARIMPTDDSLGVR
jgi:ketosteroid isomerase-like protein